ncbi:MAG: SDR family oxidoreductase [Acidimicrobiia bacterium]|nr:SDR family oxidoreductase [Acidimicrobiia bacterium]
MTGLCHDRVAIVTGGGRGIGRGHALELARQGAHVVVNDLGGGRDGTPGQGTPAQAVVDEISAMGGAAVADSTDVADFDAARTLVERTIEHFGRLDVLVNNAGILRDRMLFNMSEAEWDDVIRVHLKGTFGPMRWAAHHWRSLAKAGTEVDARIVNTSSTSGIFANPGQANYGAAKSGIATLTIIAAKELGRYGVTVNAIAPGARTRMTEDLGGPLSEQPVEGAFDHGAPENIAPLVTWLASAESAAITGQVFLVAGGRIGVATPWGRGPQVEQDARWDPTELGAVVPALVRDAER